MNWMYADQVPGDRFRIDECYKDIRIRIDEHHTIYKKFQKSGLL